MKKFRVQTDLEYDDDDTEEADRTENRKTKYFCKNWTFFMFRICCYDL